MPRQLTPEEIAERYSSGYRSEPTERAGYGSLFGGAVDTAQAGLQLVGSRLGLPIDEDTRRENQFLGNAEIQRFYDETGTPQSYKDIGSVRDAGRWLGAGLVQSAPYLAATAGGAAAGALAGGPVGAAAGGFGVGTAIGTGDIMQGQMEKSGYTRLDTALPLGVLYGAADALTGVGGSITRGIAKRELLRNSVGALDRFGGVGGALGRAGATFARRGAEEAAGEVFQEGTVQLGRMSVDDNTGLFDQDALDNYGEAAVAGFAQGGVLGAGMGGWRRSQAYQPPAPPTVDTPQFDIMQRYNLVTQPDPLQSRIDQQLGIQRQGAPKNYAQIFEAAANEPSGIRVAGPDGVERELTAQEVVDLRMGGQAPAAAAPTQEGAPQTAAPVSKVFTEQEQFLIDRGVTPRKKSLELVEEARNMGLDPESDTLTGFWTSLAESKYGKAKQALAEALIEQKKAQTNVSAPQLGTGAGTATTAQAAAVQANGAPSAPATGAVQAPATAAAGSIAAQPSPISQPVQGAVNGAQATQAVQAEAQGSQAPAAAAANLTPEASAWDEYRDETQPTWDQLPKNQQGIWRDAMAAKAKGKPINLYKVAEQLDRVAPDERQDILRNIFGQRNGDIIFDVVGMGMSEEAAAEKYGLSRSSIQAIAGSTGRKTWPERIKAAVAKYGYSKEQIAAAFTEGVSEADMATGEVEREVLPLRNMFSIGKVDSTEATMGGLENVIETAGGSTSAVRGLKKWELQFMEDLEVYRAMEAGQVTKHQDVFDELQRRIDEATERYAEMERVAQAAVAEKAGKRSKKDLKDEAVAESEKPTELDGTMPEPAPEVEQTAAPEQTEDDGRTDREKARDAWDKEALTYDGAPTFDELSEDQQERWVDYGPENWTAADVVTELARVQKEAEKSGRQYGKDRFANNPYTARELLAELSDFMRADIPGRKLMVVNDVAELLQSKDEMVRQVGAALTVERAYGVAVDGRAFLVANRVEKGTGRAKFMHEVGGHLGLENLLPSAVYNQLVSQIKAWARNEKAGLEHDIALRAAERVIDAGTPSQDMNAELVAYFLEEAVQAGIDPTAEVTQGNAGFRQWFRTLWAAFKVAVRKLGMKPESLTATDVVNLGYGAARLEIAGTWHGTAAQFRKFDHKFMGTGEGAQAFGWGTYLAQNDDVATGYWKADVKRKGGKVPGSLMRVDLAFDERETLDWDRPISKQPAIAEKLAKLPESLREAMEKEVNTDFDFMTGDDVYRSLEFIQKRDGSVADYIDAEYFNANLVNASAKKIVSTYLNRELGIPGIRFLDSKSRGTAAATVTYKGRTYTSEDFRIRTAATQKLDGTEQMLLRKVLNQGFDAAKNELESKRSKLEDMFYGIYKDSAGRFNTEFDEAKARERARGEAAETAEGKWLAWLEANADDIRVDEQPRTRNLVVFDDKDIFRVGSQVAASQERMKFGKAPTAAAVNAAVAKLPAQAQPAVRNSLKSVQSWASKGLDRVVFTSDLIGRAVKAGIPAAEKFADLVARRGTAAREMERNVEAIADMFAEIPADQREAVNQFLFDTTRSGKWPTQEQMDAFSKPAQDFINAVFKHGKDTLAKKKQTVLDYTASVYDEQIKAAEQAIDAATDKAAAAKKVADLKREKAADLKKYESLFAVREGIPYAPIKRMGDFVVVAKSAEYVAAETAGDAAQIRKLEQSDDHYLVTFKDSLFAANQLADKYRAEGYASVGAQARLKAREQFFQGAEAMTAVNKLQAMVKADAGSAGNERLQKMVTDIVLQTLADNSARKSELRRRNIGGEVDMLQSFAVQGRADAQFMASVKFNQPTQAAMQEMFKQASRASDRNRANEVVDELNDRYQSSLQFEPQPWLNKLNRMTSLYFLTTSPAYYLINLTQPWVMSLPAMAGQHNYAKVAAMLGKSYAELKDVMKSAKLFDQNFDFSKVPADVRGAINELANRGRIDIGLDTELGEFKVAEDGKLSQAWNRVDKGMRMLVQKGEAINRLTTAMTAYRLAKQSGQSEVAAINYAERILTETHGDYGSFNAPKYFNTSLGKIALQFRKFQLIQLSFYAKLIRDAGFDTAEKRAATKTLAYSLGHTGLLAGAVGMPGYAAIAWMLGALLGDEDEPYDLTYEMRKLIGDEDIANLVLRGAPTLAGVDISGRVGAGTMLSIMPFSNADMSTPQGRAEALGTLLGGAALGAANRITDGVGLMMSGDWLRGLEMALPKGIGDGIKALRVNQDGMTRRNGDVILPADEVSAVESAMQAIGFSPADQSVVYERRTRSYEMDNRMQQRSKSIKQDYVRAVKDRDAEAIQAARQEWANLQAARKRNGYTVQPMSELLRAPQEQAKRQKNTVGGVQYNRNTEGFARQNAGI